jgi:hypothetical protein
MQSSFQSIVLLMKTAILLLFFILPAIAAFAQITATSKPDSVTFYNPKRLTAMDSMGKPADSSQHSLKKYIQRKKHELSNRFYHKKDTTGASANRPVKASNDSSASSISSSSNVPLPALGQKQPTTNGTIIAGSRTDSSSKISDSTSKNVASPEVNRFAGTVNSSLPSFRKDSTKNVFKNPFSVRDSSLREKYLPTQTFVFKKAPILRFNGGYVSYGFNYRSSADTPFIEKNLAQHQINSSMHVTVAGKLPFIVNSFIRRTNSPFFSPVTDIQVLFDAPAYRSLLASNLRAKLLTGMQDSLTKNLYTISKLNSLNLQSWLNKMINRDKLVEAHEMINVPQKGYEAGVPDSVNKKHSDSLQNAAKAFIELYEKTYGLYLASIRNRDSLLKEIRNDDQKYKQLQKLLSGNLAGGSSYESWSNKVQQNSSKPIGISGTEKFLLGVRKFSVGRSTLNYSELTVKNLSLTGLNAEYNTRYYFALAAGVVNYLFTDFIRSPMHLPKQYLYVARVGLGRIEKNYFIVTGYHGEKQLFFGTSTGSQISSIHISGLSAATKWQINRYSSVIAEVAQSFSPNVLAAPELKSSWNLNDKSNKALSLKLVTYFPGTLTKVEGMYKFMGANFQAFNSFQTNAQLVSWYAKADQSFLKRKLHLLVSLRTLDYSNPYIIQDYKANTVLKSINLTYREKGLPVLSAGYMPMSQLTVVGTQVVQNQFQTLNASITHFYKIGQQQVATNLVFTRFFNSSLDTGFIYYNSTNFFLTHTLFFKRVTAGITISHSVNANYRYDVMDESFSFQVSRVGSLGGGIKINDLNQKQIALGQYANAHIRVGKKDILNIQIDNGYLPGNGNRLVKNFMGSISYTKTF